MKTNNINFMVEGDTIPFQALNRKGNIRWITSPKTGKMRVMTKFAPPTKLFPKLFLSTMALFDFRLPAIFKQTVSINISKDFLEQISCRLNIPIEEIGIYVGEPNNNQKLVATDLKEESEYLLKIAVGKSADKSIERELTHACIAKADQYWKDKTPIIMDTPDVLGHKAILITKTNGKQLTPKKFKKMVLSKIDLKSNDGVVLKNWFLTNYKFESPILKTLFEICDHNGALDLRSQLGLIHGDFAPWNAIQSSTDIVFIDLEYSREDAPLILDTAYAVWCYKMLLKQKLNCFNSKETHQLVALGALWEELRKNG